MQLATFGRKLDGHADSMPGYSLAMLKINDPEVVATSGKTHHPVVTYTGNPGDRHVIRIMGFAKAMLAMKLAGA